MYLLEGAQLLNNALFLPVALVLSADALRGLVEVFVCTGQGLPIHFAASCILILMTHSQLETKVSSVICRRKSLFVNEPGIL